MNKDPLFEHLREQAWRGKLTPSQEAQLRDWLSTHPEARDDWDAEAGLSEALGRLPDVPVPSNFTARVLGAVNLERSAAQRSAPKFGRIWERWVRWAAACAVILAALAAGLSFVERFKTERLANSIAEVSRVAPLPSPEILANFDVICALDRTPAPDEDLLKLLQ